LKKVRIPGCNQEIAGRSLQALEKEFDKLQNERFKKSTKQTLTAVKPSFLQLAERLATAQLMISKSHQQKRIDSL
jgi:hypothetical protein